MPNRMLPLSLALLALMLVPELSGLPGGEPSAEAPPVSGRDPCLEPSPLHLPLSTRSGEAQRAFDNGLAFAHSYVWHAATRCLRKALELDPELAVAHTELARSFLGREDYEEARHHAAEALKLAEGDSVSAREKAWIRLGLEQVEAATSPAALMPRRHAQYKDAIEEYIASFPDDPFGFILRGNAESPRPQGRGQSGRTGSISWYLKALEVDPSHLSAHHFLTHSYENIGRYEEAARHARQFARAASRIPHALHMLGHVLPRLGEWDEAVRVLEQAHRLHLRSFEEGYIDPEDDWHFGHNLRLLAVVHFRLGHQEKAEEYLNRLHRVDYGGDRSAYYCLPLAQYLSVLGRFEETLAHARGCLAQPEPAAKVLGEISAGEALLGLGEIEDAKASLDRASRTFQELRRPKGLMKAERQYVLMAASLSLHTLRAKIALREGNPDEGHGLLVRIADRLVGGTNFDTWASGLLHLEGMVREAQRSGRPDTAQAIASRLRHLDPGYEMSRPPTGKQGSKDRD